MGIGQKRPGAPLPRPIRQGFKAREQAELRRFEQRDGIARQPRDRFAVDLELTDAQREVLELVPAHGTAAAIARELGRSTSGVTASLYALADRGLVDRVPYKGWRRR